MYAAIALWGIRPTQDGLTALCHSVQHPPWIGRHHERAFAAAALTRIDRRNAIAVLITALADGDIAVKTNAWSGVAERLRLNAETDAHGAGQMTLREFRALAWAALDQHYPPPADSARDPQK